MTKVLDFTPSVCAENAMWGSQLRKAKFIVEAKSCNLSLRKFQSLYDVGATQCAHKTTKKQRLETTVRVCRLLKRGHYQSPTLLRQSTGPAAFTSDHLKLYLELVSYHYQAFAVLVGPKKSLCLHVCLYLTDNRYQRSKEMQFRRTFELISAAPPRRALQCFTGNTLLQGRKDELTFLSKISDYISGCYISVFWRSKRIEQPMLSRYHSMLKRL